MDDLPVFPDFPDFLLREQFVRVPRRTPSQTPRTSPLPRTSPAFGSGWFSDSIPVIPGPVLNLRDDEVYDCFISPKTMFRKRNNSLPLEDMISGGHKGHNFEVKKKDIERGVNLDVKENSRKTGRETPSELRFK